MRKQIPKRWVIEGKLSIVLDLIRWTAAAIVVLSHIKGLYFVSYSEIDNPSWYLKIVYAISSLGHQAVMVFFVLSGMLISANVMKAVEKGSWSWRTYLLHRLTRLYVVLVPALLLGLLWDYAGNSAFGATGIYDGLPEDQFILNYSSASLLTSKEFIGNLFFLQGVFVNHFGSNGPLWSLSFEFWYYILFPCMVLSISSKANSLKILYTLVVIALAFMLGEHILLYYLVWLLGFVLHLLPSSLTRKGVVFALLWPLLAIAALGGARFFPLPLNDYLQDLLLALAFSGFLYGIKLAYYRKPHVSPWLRRTSSLLAGYSYSLYLAHFPVLVFLHALTYDREPRKWQPDTQTLAYGAFLFIVISVYAWMLAQLTEKQTTKARRLIERLFLRIPSSRKETYSSFSRSK
ncbi:acyltransferase [Cohnella sp. AR92]|uniref:acyltransferase family protein n=1 Tax=Cohnella sp. AR92 TaxID=648716 RepID=UPI000F8D9440|nr:acyltransferase [Cohnella sp. AR92]RUS45252.1 acyltransferase [Cohnella sp. AR92]